MGRLFIDTMYVYRREHKFLIHRFVVMRDHFHLLLSPMGVDLSRSVQFIKGGFSYRAKRELGMNLEIWERGYVNHRIRDANDYRGHIDYIDQNPVRARIVVQACEYPYSSVHPSFELDPCPEGLKPRAVLVAERHG
jgi:putative transposase